MLRTKNGLQTLKIKRRIENFYKKNNESEKRDTMHDMKETRFWFFSMNLRSSKNMTVFGNIVLIIFFRTVLFFFIFNFFLIFTVNFIR